MNKMWWHKSVVYQVYPKSFYDSNSDGIGDLPGIIKKLDYLAILGIDILWLSPVCVSPMYDNGYDVSDYYAIAPQFGTLEDMDRLIGEAAKRGIAIMMDIVVNHTSDEHPWFIESRSSITNPKRDWYIWRDGATEKLPPTNWESFFTGSAWELDEKTGQYYLHLFGRRQPDLNWENPLVRDEVYRMMRWWLDKGIKGIRLDAIDLISKPERYYDGKDGNTIRGMELWANGPNIDTYLKEMNREVFSLYDVVTVGETSFADTKRAVAFSSPERKEMDMIFQFEHLNLDHEEIDKWERIPLDLVKLKRVMSRWQTELHGKGWNSLYWCNHDQPRIVSRFGSTDPRYRVQSAKMLAAALHLMQGTPFIYQGEEIGMTNAAFDSIEEYNDIDTLNYYTKAVEEHGIERKEALKKINRVSRDNARTPMQWSDEKNGGFTSAEPWLKVNPNCRSINVASALQDKDSVFYFYRKLVQLRRHSPYSDLIAYGDYREFCENNEAVFVYLRTLRDKRILVICSFVEYEVPFSLPFEFKHYKVSVILTNYSDRRELENGMLRPYESIVAELL